MHKKLAQIFFIAFLIGTVANSFAQRKTGRKQLAIKDTSRRLLYILDSKSKDYMLPYIEQKLKNLRFPGKNQRLFDNVSSLNTLTQSTNIEGSIITSLIENRVIKDPSIVGRKLEEYKNYLSYIDDFQSILLIKTNEFKGLIEFQFTLYESTKANQRLSYKTSSSVFIDPEKQHYQTDIIRTLEQVFVQASIAPIISMKSNLHKVNGEYYSSTKDSIIFEPLVTDDNPEDDWIYFWSQAQKDTAHYVQLAKSARKQTFKKLNKGKYVLTFSLTDGINYSKDEQITINVYTPPILHASFDGNPYYYPGDNQLVVQRYLFKKYDIRLDSKMKIRADIVDLGKGTYNLNFNILNQNRKPILQNRSATVGQGQDFNVDNLLGTYPLNDDGHNLIANLSSGSYFLSFQAYNDTLKSDSLTQELIVLQRKPLSFILDESVYPFKNYTPYSSVFNMGFGLHLKLDRAISISAFENGNISTDKSHSSFSTFFTNFFLSYDGLDDNYGAAIGVLIPNNVMPNFTTALGAKFYVKLLNNFGGDLGIAMSAFTSPNNEKIFGIHFYNSIFLK